MRLFPGGLYRGGMRGTVARRGVSGAIGLILIVVLSACATAAGDDVGTPVPSFGGPTSTVDAPPATEDPGLPDDCERILPASELGALLGQPVDSVTSRTTIGVPEPSVGRTDRVACRYATVGQVGGRPGAGLFDVNSAHYTDPAAAVAQWRTNAAVEDGPARELAIGAARAVLVERPDTSVLMVVHEISTVTLVLPVRVDDRDPQDTLVDLALRVLPRVSGPGAPATGDVASSTAL